MFFEDGLPFWPSGTYGQIYASVLITSLAWCLFRGNTAIRWLVLSVLIGWIGARYSTTTTSYLPIVLSSALGGVVAAATRTTTGIVIACLYALKIIWYTAAIAMSLPGWLFFEISTLMGWCQIVSLLVGHSGGKGTLIKRYPFYEDGNGISRIGHWIIYGFLGRYGSARLFCLVPQKNKVRRGIQGRNNVATVKNR